MDEATSVLEQQNVKALKNQNFLSAQQSVKKIKATVYLTEEAEHAFTELYIHRLRKNRKIDRSLIACEAILALYEKEVNVKV
ncbi:MAG: hypothetical protein H0T62_00635 [Parachlamydiaceae bacterium]|nr:hypothetical protein [Parachlamydiaceae bacterium]